MIIKASDLDTRITFEARQTTQDATYKTKVVTWVPYKKAWAQVRDVLPSRAEQVDSNISMSRRPCRIRIRYRRDLDSTMQIDIAGRKLRIVSGPAELGRKEGLEFMAEELTTEGVAP